MTVRAVSSIIWRPNDVTEAEIWGSGSEPTDWPVKPYTEFATTFTANWRPL